MRNSCAVGAILRHNPSMNLEKLDWVKLGAVGRLADKVLPVAVQDVESGDVVMVAYANREAVMASVAHRQAVFWSTTKDALHHKGLTSGDFLDLVEVRVNCEGNSLLYRVRLGGEGACHVPDARGIPHRSCFFRQLQDVCA